MNTKVFNKFSYNVNLCIEYEKTNGKITRNTIDANGNKLGNWLDRQKCRYKNHLHDLNYDVTTINNISAMTTHEIDKICQISSFNIWKLVSNVLKTNLDKFYHNVNLCIEYEKTNEKIINTTIDNNGNKLGNWLNHQKCRYKNYLHNLNYNIPKNIKVGTMTKQEFNKMCQIKTFNIWKTKEFHKFYHNVNLCIEYEKTNKKITSITIDNNGNKLGIWLNHQKCRYKNYLHNLNYNIPKCSSVSIMTTDELNKIYQINTFKEWYIKFNQTLILNKI